jgi:orotidine-5'-phosphate decarboxylase
MSASTFLQRLDAAMTSTQSLVCVGLDPEIEKFPVHLRQRPQAILEFNRAIIDATADFACAYKPQIETIRYIRHRAPGIQVILDSKRGDIGSTAEKYAREAFERYGADAVTINPYLGRDSAEPFLEYADKGVVVLCRTSNAGARELQDLDVGGRKLYQLVAEKVASEWNARGNCLLVVGATYPDELADIRRLTGDMTFLVPGIGAQGGDIEKAVRNGRRADGRGLVINSSRGIIYASQGEDFAAAARRATLELRDAVNAVPR